MHQRHTALKTKTEQDRAITVASVPDTYTKLKPLWSAFYSLTVTNNSGGINPTLSGYELRGEPAVLWRATGACGRASGQVLNQTKDGNDDFLFHVGMRLGSHGPDCSMRTRASCLGARLRGGRARNSPC